MVESKSNEKYLDEICSLNLKHSKIRDNIRKLSKKLNDDLLTSIDGLETKKLRNLQLNVKTLKEYDSNVKGYIKDILEFVIGLLIALGMYFINSKNYDIASFFKEINISNLVIVSSGLFSAKAIISFISNLILGSQKEGEFNSDILINYILDSKKENN